MPTRRRTRAAWLAALSVLLPFLVQVPSASAADLPATFSADPLPTWQTNGAVWALEQIDGVVYVGGVFTQVRPPGAAEGAASSVARNNFAAFDGATGALLPCNPSITLPNGSPGVFALEASPSGDVLYVGGRFSRVGATSVANLVGLVPGSCALSPTSTFRRPALNGPVRALSAASTGLYVGGEFGTADGQTRTRYAAFSRAGVLKSGGLTLDGTVRAVVAAPDFGKVIVGGNFLTVNGASVRGLVAVDPESSAVVHTFPGWIPASSVPKALERDGDSFYLGAEGSGFGVFDGRAKGDLATGQMVWRDNCLGATQALAVDGDVLYGGHHTHECMLTPGGWLEDGFRNHLTAQDTTTKEILPTFFPDTNDGIGTAPQGPRALTVTGDQIWVGGEFTTVNEAPQRGLTRFARADTGTTFAPTLSVSTARAGVNVVSWLQAFDRDDDALTYELFRNGTLVHSVTARSREWSRGQMAFADTGVSPGQSATYRIRVVEADGGNTGSLGAAVTVTTSGSDQGYAGAVLRSEPSLYWKLDETVEQDARTRTGELYYRARALDSSPNGRQGTADRGYTTLTPAGYALGGPSALADGSGSSITFSGTTGRVAESFTNDFAPVQDGPATYSTELWFRTTGSTGGRLAGFGDRRTELYERVQPSGTAPAGPPVYDDSQSTRTDRLLYLSDTGRVVFGTLSGSTKVTIRSGTGFNDQQWHHAVATSGPGGMRLYVDGLLRASGTSAANAVYPGYWKVGFDTLSGWADRPASSALRGGVDEFAVYPRALTAAEVAGHYLAGRPGADIDVSPPSSPGAPSLSRAGQAVSATWAASTDDRAVVRYDVYRSANPGDPLSSAVLVGSSTTTSFTEAFNPGGTWTYRVVAADAAGNESAPSAGTTITVPTPPVSTVSTLAPTADSYVNTGLKSTNFGSATNVIVDSDPAQYALMRFALPAAPSGSTLTSAVLRVRTTSAAAASSVDTHTVRFGSDAWTESTVTWNNRPAADGTVLGSVPAGTVPNQTYSVDLDVAAVRAALGQTRTVAVVGDGPDSLLLATREAAVASRPQLVLTFSGGGDPDGEPEPDTSAPTAPGAPALTRSGQVVSATWSGSSDDTGVVRYDLFRSDAPATPSSWQLVATSVGAGATDPANPGGTWTYRVEAVDAAGNRSAPSAGTSIEIPVPTVTSTATLTPSADTYVNSALRSQNFGTATNVIADSDPQQYALYRFVLPSAPPGAVLTGAELRVRTHGSTSASSVDAHALRFGSDDWVETAVTWDTRPAADGATLGTIPGGTGVNQTYAVPLDVAALQPALGSTRTVAVVPLGPDSLLLTTRESAAGSRPQLVLTFSGP